MEDNKTYFGEIGHGLKTLATGMKITWKEYFKDFFTNKSTEQYPENRKTTLHVAKRHRGRLVFKRNEDGSYKCTACTLCEKTCPNGTIKITSHMALHLDKEVYKGGSLPGIINGGAPQQIGKFNTKTK